jgi:antitoxin PrlF
MKLVPANEGEDEIFGALAGIARIKGDPEIELPLYFYENVKQEAVVMEATLSSKNQATIPKQVGDFLNLKAGDRFKFFLQPDGRVVILPLVRISKLKGSVRKLARPVSLEEMDEAIAAGATKRHRK